MGDIAQDIQSKFKSDKVKALINIMYTANWISSKQVEFFKPYDLSPQQYNILRILRGAKGPMKAQTVKERMIERSPNATRLMDKLCEKKLIQRNRSESDRRVVYIEINQQGLDLLKEIDESNRFDFLSKISNEEAKLLSDLLDKIR
ncbi:MAG: MarR family transcriptional regulator [Flavobacteriaceae bacterium]|nr:MarR family transcriptional regulator [Flavobacteriaceae bacterium]